MHYYWRADSYPGHDESCRDVSSCRGMVLCSIVLMLLHMSTQTRRRTEAHRDTGREAKRLRRIHRLRDTMLAFKPAFTAGVANSFGSLLYGCLRCQIELNHLHFCSIKRGRSGFATSNITGAQEDEMAFPPTKRRRNVCVCSHE